MVASPDVIVGCTIRPWEPVDLVTVLTMTTIIAINTAKPNKLPITIPAIVALLLKTEKNHITISAI